MAPQWQTDGVPAPLSILIAFGVIAGLAVVLRWTYGSDMTDRRYQLSPADGDEPADTGPDDPIDSDLESVPDGRHDTIDPAPSHDESEGSADDLDAGYGLLRTVLIVDDSRQAEGARDVLRTAGIRSTTARRSGAVRVLVFVDQLDEARRLVR
jgi:hypothetical protein